MNGTTKNKTPRMHMMMCFGTACLSSGAERVKTALEEQLEVQGMADEVRVIETGCNGFCAGGPLLVVYPGGVFYNKVQPEDTAEIVSEHVIKGRPVERLMYQHPTTQARIPLFKDIPFFARQNLRVLRNKGRIAAESIDEYIARDGYAGLRQGPHRDDPRGDRRRDQEERSARPRRRRFPHRPQVGVRRQGPGRQEVHPLQRRRGRPRARSWTAASWRATRTPCSRA